MRSDSEFMALATAAASKSRDRSRKVGCIIVGADGEVRASGFNSFPEGVDETPDERHARPEKYLWTEHAERNAIYKAARFGVTLDGCRIFLPWYPCMDCARAIIQSGIVEMIATAPDHSDPKWGEEFQRVEVMLREGGIAVRFIT